MCLEIASLVYETSFIINLVNGMNIDFDPYRGDSLLSPSRGRTVKIKNWRTVEWSMLVIAQVATLGSAGDAG